MFSEADIPATPRECHGLRIRDLSGSDTPTFFIMDIAPDGLSAAHCHLVIPGEELPGLLGEVGLTTDNGAG